MKVIFLDIDGVLNSFQTFREIYYEYKKTGRRRVAIDENKVLLLKQIVDNTNAMLVLSSSWRNFGRMENDRLVTNNKNLRDLVSILAKYGLFIYDITPKSREGKREVEIKKWLCNNSDNVEKFIVIDDDIDDLESFKDKELFKTIFIKIDSEGNYLADESGLTINHVKDAIDKLNNKKDYHARMETKIKKI